MVDLEKLQQNFSKELSNLHAAVQKAADTMLYGSYSERHPGLGKMIRCPHCGFRRRLNQLGCCNPQYATTQRAWSEEKGFHQAECPERRNDNLFSQRILKRLVHQQKRHGQNRLFKIRQVIYLLQNSREIDTVHPTKSGKPEDHIKIRTTHAALAAAREMRVAPPALANIPSFAEKYWNWLQKRIVKKHRKISAESRRINRELS